MKRLRVCRRWAGIVLPALLACTGINAAADELRSQVPIVVGCLADAAPLSEQAPGETPRGLLLDLWRLWSQAVGQEIEFRCGERSAVLDDLAAGRTSVLAGVDAVPGTASTLAYGEPIYPVSASLVHRRNLTPPLTLEGRTLGVRRGSTHGSLAASVFPQARVIEVDSHRALRDGLEDGSLEAILTETLAGATIASRRALSARFMQGSSRYLETHLRPAVLQSNRRWLATIDRGFAALDEDAISAVERRWIAEPELRRVSNRQRGIALTAEERAFLDAHPVLRYGVMGSDWSPVEVLEADGTVSGITPAFRDLVATRLGIRFELVRAQGWMDLDERLRRREVDVTGSLADAPSRRGYLSTTRPYLTGELGIVTLADNTAVATLADLAGRRLAMESGYATTLWIERNFPTATIVYLPDTPTALRAVSEGRADAYLGSVMTTTHAIRQLLLTNLRVIGTRDVFPFELRFGVRSDWPLAASILDKAVASLSPAERSAIRDRWVSATVVERRDWGRILLVVVPSFAALAVFVTAVVFWNRRLRREIEERRRAQAALDEQIAFRSALLDALAEPVVFKDGAGRYLGCNRAFEEFYGVRREDLVGRTLDQISHIRDETKARVLATDDAVLEDGQTRTVRLRTHRHDGAEREILYSLSPLPRSDAQSAPGGLVGVIVDITDLEAARAQALAAETLLRDITDTAPGVVWRYESRPGERGRFTFVSAGIRHLHGIEPRAALEDPRAVFNTMVEPDRSALIARINAATGSPELLQTEYRIRLPDGTVRWLSVRAQPRAQADGSVLWDGTAYDISDEKRLQAELVEARTAAEAANQAKSRFVAKISHEIRTPLAGMIGMLRLLRGTPRPDDPERMLGLVETSADGLLRVLNDILDISKIEAGRLTLERSAFDLVDLTDQAIALATSQRGRKPVAVTVVRADGLPRRVLGDALRVRQVIDNLLSNAVKFTENGSVTLTVAPAADGLVRFDVADTGVGFDTMVRDALFQPYEQAGPATARRYGGTGLGLAISRELTALMGGRIEAEGSPGHGARFTFWLPLPPAADDAAVEQLPDAGSTIYDAPEVEAAREGGGVVLVADDDDLYREVIVRQLQGLGCVVEEHRNGAEILAALDRDPRRYGLLVTDGHMPVLDGFALVRHLRHSPSGVGRDLPVILLSATTQVIERDPPGGELVGAYFQKPVGLSTLDAALRRLAPRVVALRSASGNRSVVATAEPASPIADLNEKALRDLLGTSDPTELGPFCHRAVAALASLPARVAEAVSRRDADPVMDIAHAAKGSAGSAGADRLAALMRELHTTARQGRWDEAGAVAADIGNAYAAYARAVDRAFPMQGPA